LKESFFCCHLLSVQSKTAGELKSPERVTRLTRPMNCCGYLCL